MDESWAQWSLTRGMESLPESISEYLQQSGKVQLHREAAVKRINPSASGWKVGENPRKNLESYCGNTDLRPRFIGLNMIFNLPAVLTEMKYLDKVITCL